MDGEVRPLFSRPGLGGVLGPPVRSASERGVSVLSAGPNGLWVGRQDGTVGGGGRQSVSWAAPGQGPVTALAQLPGRVVVGWAGGALRVIGPSPGTEDAETIWTAEMDGSVLALAAAVVPEDAVLAVSATGQVRSLRGMLATGIGPGARFCAAAVDPGRMAALLAPAGGGALVVEIGSGRCTAVELDEPVLCAAVLPGEGGWLAATVTHHVVRLTPDGRVIRSPQSWPSSPISLTPSSDGTRFLVGAADGTLRLWDTASLEPIGLMPVQVCASGAVTSGDGQEMHVGLADGGTERLSVAEVVDVTAGHQGSVWTLATHPTDLVLASGSSDGTVRIWDLVSGAPVRVLSGHEGWVNAVAFDPAGGVLASGSSDGTVRIWDLVSGAPVRVLSGHEGWVNAVAFDPAGGVLASGSSDGTVRIWDPACGTRARVLAGHGGGGVTSVAWGTGPVGLVSTGYDGRVLGWPADDPVVLGSHDRRVWMVATAPGSEHVASIGADRRLKIWRTGGGTEAVREIPLSDVGTACHLRRIGSGDYALAYAERGGGVAVVPLRLRG